MILRGMSEAGNVEETTISTTVRICGNRAARFWIAVTAVESVTARAHLPDGPNYFQFHRLGHRLSR